MGSSQRQLPAFCDHLPTLWPSSIISTVISICFNCSILLSSVSPVLLPGSPDICGCCELLSSPPHPLMIKRAARPKATAIKVATIFFRIPVLSRFLGCFNDLRACYDIIRKGNLPAQGVILIYRWTLVASCKSSLQIHIIAVDVSFRTDIRHPGKDS